MFSKLIRELVMYWRAKGINILPYLDDLVFLFTYCVACRRLSRIVEEDMLRLAGLTINWKKGDGIPSQERLHSSFIVNIAEGSFQVPIHIWEALKTSAELFLS